MVFDFVAWSIVISVECSSERKEVRGAERGRTARYTIEKWGVAHPPESP